MDVSVKKFWRFVDANLDGEVSSIVLGLPIKITQQSLGAITRCPNEGVLLENGYELRVDSFRINKELFEIPKVNSKFLPLKPKYKVLFKIMIGCVVPKCGSVGHVSKDHEGLMWNISQKIRTNLPHIILKHMRSCVINSRTGNIKFITYPRLITVVLMRTSLIQSLEKVGGFVQEEHLLSSSLPYSTSSTSSR